MILSLFKPKYYMPVKGEYRQLMANAKIALSLNHGYSHLNTFIADNGMILYFDDNGKAHLTPMPVLKSGDLLVDGIGVGDVKEVVLQERQKMSDDGVIVLAVTVSSKLRKVISSPDVQMRGFIFLKIVKILLRKFLISSQKFFKNYALKITFLRGCRKTFNR